MKKLSLLLLVAVYFCFVQTAVAQTINANGVDPANAVWYVIKNNGTGEYLRFDGKRFPMSTNEGTFSGGGSTATGLDTYNMFYFAYGAGGNSGKVYMHTYESELLCAAPDLWTAAGAEIAINAQGRATIFLLRVVRFTGTAMRVLPISTWQPMKIRCGCLSK